MANLRSQSTAPQSGSAATASTNASAELDQTIQEEIIASTQQGESSAQTSRSLTKRARQNTAGDVTQEELEQAQRRLAVEKLEYEREQFEKMKADNARKEEQARTAASRIGTEEEIRKLAHYGQDISIWMQCFAKYIAIYAHLFDRHTNVALAMVEFMSHVGERAQTNTIESVIQYAVHRMQLAQLRAHNEAEWREDKPKLENDVFKINT